ncbi:MAG: CBS domain-containing protein [Gemmataceae bacterium]|nr:CBS domain-containing protein [Gemmataceae bacterium]
MNISEFDDAYEDRELIRGAILATPISELPLRRPIIVDAGATVVAAVNAMNEHRTGCVLVERDGKLSGIFTERDVLTKVIFRASSSSMRVEEVDTNDPETLEATATIAFALNKMSVGGYRHIPVVDRGGKPVGVLSVRDIVDFLVELFPDGVLNLPPSPDKAIAKSLDGG